MVLSKVEYEFFDFEEPLSTATELARQIRLRFSDVPTVYLSWTFERQHGLDDQPYSIAYAIASYCSDEPASVVDVSESSLWSRHVGRNIELRYRPSTQRELEHQVVSHHVRSAGPDPLHLPDRPVPTRPTRPTGPTRPTRPT